MAINGRCRTYVNRYRNVAKEMMMRAEGRTRLRLTTVAIADASNSNSSNSDGGDNMIDGGSL